MFSDREKKILKILSDKELSFGIIAEKLFKDDVPMDSNILVSNSINRIIKKCHYNKLDWNLTKIRHPSGIVLVTKESI